MDTKLSGKQPSGPEIGRMSRTYGYVKVADLLNLRDLRRLHASLDDIKIIVAQDTKIRFKLMQNEQGEWLIRANQGHSIKHLDDSSLLTEIKDAGEVKQAIHGTYWDAWKIISQE
eukprot:g7256.t1